MSWADIENAMHAVVVRNSGLESDRVTWAYQNVNETELDHVVLNFLGAQSIGIDRISTTQDLTRPNGQEIAQEVKGVREVPLEIHCYTTAVTGDAAARQLAERIRSKFRLDTSVFDLRRVQVSVFDTGQPIQWVPYIPAADFRGRAVLTVRCYVPLKDCIEYVGYIARVTGRFFPVGWSGASGSSGCAFDSNNGT